MIGHIQSLKVEGFRSIRDLEVRFDSVNLITGPNGCGKSNLFNAFRLLKASMQGRLGAAIAEEGGMNSIVWAGQRKEGPVRMAISVSMDPFDYELELGLRPRSEFPLFPADPQIKREIVKLGGRVMVDRKTSTATMRPLEGPSEMRIDLIDSESIFSQIQDPAQYPFLYQLREMVDRWIFYHEFRTDSESPLRRPALATYAPRLAEDGSNLGPALYVIRKRGDIETLARILKGIFPDAELFPDDPPPELNRGLVELVFEGLHRVVSNRELSDGTLKFLCLAVACFAVRPPPLIAFNEPEASLSPAAIEPLAEVLAYASQHSQLWVTTHSTALARHLTDRLACRPLELSKVDGETVVGSLNRRKGWRSDE